MDAHLTEWLSLGARWIHLVVGVAWIGGAFYVARLERSLVDDGPADGIWTVHGDGIYHLEYRRPPARRPPALHGFERQAYATWLSGMALLILVYYLDASQAMLAPGSALPPALAVGIGLGSLLVGWIIYESLCETVLGKRPVLLGLLLFALLSYAAWGYAQLFAGRAAYIHVGALLGTLMAGNLLRVIGPTRRALLTHTGEPDAALAAKARLRSRHNQYFTLPLLFSMIGNHFPILYGVDYNWLVLAGIAALALLAQQVFTTRHTRGTLAWALPTAALGLFCLVYLSAPGLTPQPTPPVAREEIVRPEIASEAPLPPAPSVAQDERLAIADPVAAEPVEPLEEAREFALVRQIIEDRCLECHSATPSSPIFTSAPLGAVFDTPEQIRQMREKIHAQAVATQSMPLANLTQMSQEERDLLGSWIEKGAPIP